MIVKGKYSAHTKAVDECETGAIGKAQPFIFKTFKNGFRSFFNLFGDMQYGYMAAFIDLIHKFYSDCMAAFCLEKGVNFIQYIIRVKMTDFSF